MTDPKQLESVEHYKYLGSVITNELKSMVVVTKAAFNKMKTVCASKLDLNLRNKLAKCYIWCTAFV